VATGIAIGCAETAERAAVATLAPVELRGSAFGLLAAVQSFGNLAASAIAGLLWMLASPWVAFGYLVAWMGSPTCLRRGQRIPNIFSTLNAFVPRR
jgi:hypothetical protein